jgi:hypothetical protein
MPTLKRDMLSTIPAKNIARLAKHGEKLLTQEYDESSERYYRILRSSQKDITSDDFLKEVYEMLIAFKMNSRGAKLSTLPDFKRLIKKHANTIQSLAKFKLEKVKATDDSFKEAIDSLFCNLSGLTQTKAPLVTFAKTMHFLLPDLFMPIDRRYTLRFFYESNPLNQKQCFLQVFEQFRQFAQKHHETLKGQVDKNSHWNRNIPKIIDNIIIAYVSENMESQFIKNNTD